MHTSIHFCCTQNKNVIKVILELTLDETRNSPLTQNVNTFIFKRMK